MWPLYGNLALRLGDLTCARARRYSVFGEHVLLAKSIDSYLSDVSTFV